MNDYVRLRMLKPMSSSSDSASTPRLARERQGQMGRRARERCIGVPIILVALKKDLREDPLAQEEMRKKSWKFVSTKEGNDMREMIGARKYLECSSLTGDGVDDVFEAATRAAMIAGHKGRHGKGRCVIL